VLVGGTIFSNKYKILTKLKIFINEFILNKLDCYPVDLVLSLGVDFHPKKIKSLKKQCEVSKVIFYRDVESACNAKSICSLNNSVIMPDTVFSLKESINQVLGQNTDSYIDQQKEISYVIRDWPYNKRVDKFLKTFPKKINEKCTVIDFLDTKNDAKDAIVYKRDIPSFIKVLIAMKSSSVVVSSRYHGLILAAILGVPLVGVNVDEKISNFCKKYSVPLIEIGDDSEEIKDKIKSACQVDVGNILKLLDTLPENICKYFR